jgi:hypothetical protein
VVRAAAVDAAGRVLNVYPLVHPVSGNCPQTPWAVYLADREGRFRLVCADLDAKAGPEIAARDAERLAGLLVEVGVPHLVCRSGPSGGRHVWIGLAETVDADLLGVLARLLRGWLPSLDVSALLNPATGCVRPPGAPHRSGGVSEVISGDVSTLTNPTVTEAQLRQVIERLADQHTRGAAVTRAGTSSAATMLSASASTSVEAGTGAPSATVRRVGEADGVPFLVGRRRPLSASCRALLAVVPEGDASAVLWRIVCGAAAAHWRYPDIATLVDAPGLEHARTVRDGTRRVPRPVSGAGSPAAVLRRQWTRAVTALAGLAPLAGLGDDATFETRAELVAGLVEAVQRRADAVPGRWGASRAGLAQRRVLDAVCRLQLDAVRVDHVEADIRRLALICGLDRETVRRALLALATDGWLERTHPAVGPHGARWSIDPGGVLHRQIERMLSQAVPRPPGTGPALRILAQRDLTDRLTAAAHDAFSPRRGWGIETGSLYAHLARPVSTSEAAHRFGWTLDQTRRVLHRLGAAGLVHHTGGCWGRTAPAALDRVADQAHTAGRLQARAVRYATERAAWAWWQAELARLRATPSTGLHRGGPRSGRPRPIWPAHPRRHNGRADYAAARHALQEFGARNNRPAPASPPIGGPTRTAGGAGVGAMWHRRVGAAQTRAVAVPASL